MTIASIRNTLARMLVHLGVSIALEAIAHLDGCSIYDDAERKCNGCRRDVLKWLHGIPSPGAWRLQRGFCGADATMDRLPYIDWLMENLGAPLG